MKKPKTSRRNFIKTGAATTSALSVVGASRVSGTIIMGDEERAVESATTAEVKEMMNKTQVINVYERLGKPPLQFGNAVKVKNDSWPHTAPVLAVPSPVGALTYYSLNGIPASTFFFESDSIDKNAKPGYLKRQFRDYIGNQAVSLTAIGENPAILDTDESSENNPVLGGISTQAVISDPGDDAVAESGNTIYLDGVPILKRIKRFTKFHDCDADSNDIHKYWGVTFELTETGTNIQSSVAGAVVATLLGPTSWAGLFSLGIVAQWISEFSDAGNVTLGCHDYDTDYYFGYTKNWIKCIGYYYEATRSQTIPYPSDPVPKSGHM